MIVIDKEKLYISEESQRGNLFNILKNCVVSQRENKFIYKNWSVILVEREEMLGSIRMIRVKISLIGDDKIIDYVIANFRKIFMRAGG